MKNYERYIKELRKFYNGGNLTLFIGSGCSKQFGAPTWNEILLDYIKEKSKQNDELLKILVKCMGIKCEESEISIEYIERKLDKGEINLLQLAQFLDTMVENSLSDNEFKEFICGKTNIRGKASAENHYLKECTEVKNFITTNYDPIIEEYFGVEKCNVPQRGANVGELKIDQNKKTVLKIHGSVDDAKSIVITEKDYHLFESESPYIYSKMDVLFAETTVLFAGYSLYDPDTRRYLYRIKDLKYRPAYFISYDAVSNEECEQMLRLFNIKVLTLPKAENKKLTLSNVIEDIKKEKDLLTYYLPKIINYVQDVQGYEDLPEEFYQSLFRGTITKEEGRVFVEKLNEVGVNYYNKSISEYDSRCVSSKTSKLSLKIVEACTKKILSMEQFSLPILSKLAIDVLYYEDKFKLYKEFHGAINKLSKGELGEFYSSCDSMNTFGSIALPLRFFEYHVLTYKILSDRSNIRLSCNEFEAPIKIYEALLSFNKFDLQDENEREFELYKKLCETISGIIEGKYDNNYGKKYPDEFSAIKYLRSEVKANQLKSLEIISFDKIKIVTQHPSYEYIIDMNRTKINKNNADETEFCINNYIYKGDEVIGAFKELRCNNTYCNMLKVKEKEIIDCLYFSGKLTKLEIAEYVNMNKNDVYNYMESLKKES